MAEPAPDTSTPRDIAPERPAESLRAGAGRRLTIALAIVSGLLLLLSAGLGIGWGEARDRAAAAEHAAAQQRHELQVRLDEAGTARAGLEARLRESEGKLLDPAGYEKIKTCVRQYAEMERQLKAALDNPPGGGEFVVFPDGRIPPRTADGAPGTATLEPLTTCIDAEQALR